MTKDRKETTAPTADEAVNEEAAPIADEALNEEAAPIADQALNEEAARIADVVAAWDRGFVSVTPPWFGLPSGCTI